MILVLKGLKRRKIDRNSVIWLTFSLPELNLGDTKFRFYGKTACVTIRWKAVEQYVTVVLFVFQFFPGCNIAKFVNFGLGTVRKEWFKSLVFTVEDERSFLFCCYLCVRFGLGTLASEKIRDERLGA